MSFATQLKRIREKYNVTQKELADYLNVTRPTIAGYETKGKEPDYRTLLLLSSYFHVSVDTLLTGREFPDSIAKEVLPPHNSENSDYIADIQAENDTVIRKIIENTSYMETADLYRMLEYSRLLLLQPQYNSKERE